MPAAPATECAGNAQDRMATGTAVVVGEALVDVFDDGRRVAGGAPFNVARWLAALGLPVRFIGRIGRADDGAACVREAAALAGLDMGGVQLDAERPTGRVTVTRVGASHRFDIGEDAAWDRLDEAEAVAALRAAAPQLVIFGTLAQRHPVARRALRACVDATPALRLVDLNLRAGGDAAEVAEATLERADWVKLNDEEFDRVRAWFAPAAATPEHALGALVTRFGLQRVIVTCGPDGWYSAGASGQRDAWGPAPVQDRLSDTVGAGDAFTAALAAGMLHGWPLVRSLQAAATLGSLVCGVPGAMPGDPATLQRWRQDLGFGASTPSPTGPSP